MSPTSNSAYALVTAASVLVAVSPNIIAALSRKR